MLTQNWSMSLIETRLNGVDGIQFISGSNYADSMMNNRLLTGFLFLSKEKLVGKRGKQRLLLKNILGS